MGVVFKEAEILFQGDILDDSAQFLRDYLKEVAPKNITFDLTSCTALHVALFQLLLAYKKLYECRFIFGDNLSQYRAIMEGFQRDEEHCS